MSRNKDGSLRKHGSGRTKGATSLESVRFGDLKRFFGDESQILVSRKLLESIGFLRPVNKETKHADVEIIDNTKK